MKVHFKQAIGILGKDYARGSTHTVSEQVAHHPHFQAYLKHGMVVEVAPKASGFEKPEALAKQVASEVVAKDVEVHTPAPVEVIADVLEHVDGVESMSPSETLSEETPKEQQVVPQRKQKSKTKR